MFSLFVLKLSKTKDPLGEELTSIHLIGFDVAPNYQTKNIGTSNQTYLTIFKFNFTDPHDARLAAAWLERSQVSLEPGRLQRHQGVENPAG